MYGSHEENRTYAEKIGEPIKNKGELGFNEFPELLAIMRERAEKIMDK